MTGILQSSDLPVHDADFQLVRPGLEEGERELQMGLATGDANG